MRFLRHLWLEKLMDIARSVLYAQRTSIKRLKHTKQRRALQAVLLRGKDFNP
jgi:hypothetical protein